MSRSSKGQTSSTTTICTTSTNNVLWTRLQLSTFATTHRVFSITLALSFARSLTRTRSFQVLRMQQQHQPNKPSKKNNIQIFIHSFVLVVDDIVFTDLVQLLSLPRVGRYSCVPPSPAPCECLLFSVLVLWLSLHHRLIVVFA